MPDTDTCPRVLSEDEKTLVRLIKTAGEDLIRLCDMAGGDRRAMDIARAKAEEAVMWAEKAITS
jgi:hypothetical protein